MRRISKSLVVLVAAMFCAVQGVSAHAASLGAAAAIQDKRPCGVVTVAAAADLLFAMNDITPRFEKATGCRLRVSIGSSGNLLTQIENGAPFDVFFSADIAYPNKLEAEGLAVPGSIYPYAVGRIVLWVRQSSPLDVDKGLELLRNPAVKKIAIANPEYAPYGRAAMDALRNSGIYGAVKNRLVLGENISQAAEFVESGNADVGILALSLVVSPTLKNKGRAWLIPESLYKPIDQGAVLVRRAPNQRGGRALLEYIKTPAAVAVLKHYGFFLPDAPPNRDGKP